MQEKSYVMLSYFGVEGKNYAMTPDGKVGLPPGVTNDSNTYPIDAAGFWFVSKDLMPPLASWTDSYIKHRAELSTILLTDPLNGFIIDIDPVKTEAANCANVFIQYATPLMVGSVANVDTAFSELERRAKAAGIDRCLEEARKQLGAYVQNLK
jgi:putative aldouronate transport system substrate-binding protein